MALLQTLARKSRSLVRMDDGRRRMMIEAVLWLTVARIATWFVPFRKIAPTMGTVMTPAQGAARMAGEPGSPDAAKVAKDIGWVVRRTADYVPFEAVCLQQALAGYWMLRRRGVVSCLHLGVVPQTALGKMKAHAWLDAAGVKVTGYPFDDDYTEIACFV
jgi:hypothetical protein